MQVALSLIIAIELLAEEQGKKIIKSIGTYT